MIYGILKIKFWVSWKNITLDYTENLMGNILNILMTEIIDKQPWEGNTETLVWFFVWCQYSVSIQTHKVTKY